MTTINEVPVEFKPGDILYRKYSDKNDLYCVITITDGPFNVGPNVQFIKLLPFARIENHSASSVALISEESISAKNWFIKIDLNNYECKAKFLNKIKEFIENNLGKMITHEKILDNLLYIEILNALKKYEKSDIIVEEK